VRRHLKSVFGMEGVWLPISAWVRRLMEEDHRYPAPWPLPWYPMIDVDTWCTEPVQWRGVSRYAPVVGRHGRDTYTKWPASADALAQAYGAGQDWEVRFLGGAQHATAMLGGRPANWSIIPFDDISVEEFLRDLDFYIHYPHEQYIEEFGRGVMEAMAFGIPVILPRQFKETFGSAATYARPDEVSEVISELWRSREHYLERAHAARSFVLKNCSLSTFPDRLAALLDSDQRATSSADSSNAAGG
jgi:glycosyltransferase involved in cell wall biosynthesis